MPNVLLTPKVYANTMLKLLKNNLVMGKLVTTKFNDEFKKVGSTVFVKRPPEFTVRTGATASIQDVIEGEVPITIDRQRGIDIQFSSLEDTLTVTDLLKSNIMQSEAAQLAQTIDSDLMACTLGFPSWVGTPGNAINTIAGFFAGPTRLDNAAVPQNDRNAVLQPTDYWALASNFAGLYAQTGVANDALQRAKLPMVGNVDPYMTQSVINLTTGTRTNGTVSGANQNVAYTAANSGYTQTLNLAGLGANATVAVGEVFTIAGVFAVNPRTKAVLPYLQQFVIVTGGTASAGGALTVTIANPIITTGAYQTVSAAPANGAVVTWVGAASTTFPQNAVFHKQAIALVFAKLTDPFTGTASYATDPETGVSVRYWRSSDITNDVHLHRWDVLYGCRAIDPRLGTRLSGA